MAQSLTTAVYNGFEIDDLGSGRHLDRGNPHCIPSVIRRGESERPQSVANCAWGKSQPVANLSARQSLQSEAPQHIVVNPARMVVFGVLGKSHQLQVLDPVIVPISVDVVNAFTSHKRPSEMALHDQFMLQAFSSISITNMTVSAPISLVIHPMLPTVLIPPAFNAAKMMLMDGDLGWRFCKFKAALLAFYNHLLAKHLVAARLAAKVTTTLYLGRPLHKMVAALIAGKLNFFHASIST